MAGPLYASVSDLRQVLNSTDAGTGTASQLTDYQLTLALQSASDRISVYTGAIFDSSTPQAIPPGMFGDLALDIAAFLATARYMKMKAMGADHPVRVAYAEAQKMLDAVRDGKIRLDVGNPSAGDDIQPLVINRVPLIFSGKDSNTRLDAASGYLEPDTPTGSYTAGSLLDDIDFGPVYQG
jgi:phage gp36-like protein